MLASCGKEVKIHEWPEGILVGGISSISGVTFKGLSWSNSGNKLLTVPSGHNPILLKECNSEESAGDVYWADDLKGLDGGIESGIFPNTVENYLTIGLVTGQIMAYDISKQCTVKTYACLPDPVTLLDYTYDDTLLAAACRSGKIYFYDCNGLEDICLTVPKSKTVTTMMFHPNSDSYLLAGSKEGILAGWDVNSGVVKFQCHDHLDDVADICIIEEESLVSVSFDQTVLIYDLRTPSIVQSVNFGMSLTSVAYYRPTEDILLGTTEGRILSFDRRRPNILKYSFDSQKNTPVKTLSLSTQRQVEPKYSQPICADTKYATPSITNLLKGGDYVKGDMCAPKMGTEANQLIDDNFPIMQMGEGNNAPYYQLIEENSLKALKQEIINTNKEIIKKFMDDITDQFLKIRMDVSREFCQLERIQNQKWQAFHSEISKLASQERNHHRTVYEFQHSEDTDSYKNHTSTNTSKYKDDVKY